MESLNTLLESISTDLRELTASVNRLRRDGVSKDDLAHLVQQTSWDLNMLRQSSVSKDNLRSLGGQLVTRRDLHHALESICRRLGSFRFENHQEHQELFRTLDEGPYGLDVRRRKDDSPPRAGAAATHKTVRRREGDSPPRAHERSATIDQASVLEIEEVGAVMVPRSKVATAG
jgi:hypothetical protein